MSTEKPTAEDYARDLGRHLSPFGVSQPTRKYWAGVMLGWASEVLQPPQLEECAKVLEGIEDGYAAMRRAEAAEAAILEFSIVREEMARATKDRGVPSGSLIAKAEIVSRRLLAIAEAYKQPRQQPEHLPTVSR